MTDRRAEVVYKNNTYKYFEDPAQVSNPLPGLTVTWLTTGPFFHYGTDTQSASVGVAVENPSYTATIFDGATQLAPTYNVTSHYWNAIWRHRYNNPVVINGPQQLMAAGLIPPWARLLPNELAPDPGGTYTGPMSLAGVYQPMGTSGERADIGSFHERTGRWLLGGAPDSMFSYDEGLGSLNIFNIDNYTGRFWNKLDFPLSSVYDNQNPTNPATRYWINPGPVMPSSYGWEVAHHPEAAAGAALATEDLYYLIILQATANMTLLWSVFHYYGGESYATIGEGQTRGMAHSLRTLGLVLIVTKFFESRYGTLPEPLLPYSYWKQIVDNQLAHITKVWMNSPVAQTFRAFPNVAAFAPWQQDHLLNGLFFLAWKNPEWRPLFKWAFYNLYKRCKMLPAYPGPYQLRLGPNFVDGQILDPAKLTVSQFYGTWEEMTQANLQLSANTSGGYYNLSQAQANALMADPTNGGKWMPANTFNMFIARNALSLGLQLHRWGYINLLDECPDIEAVFAQQDDYAKKYFSDINQIEPSRQAAYPLPANLPPPGDINMGQPISINVGQKKTIPFTYSKGGAASQPPTSVSAATIPANLGSCSNIIVNTDGTGSVDLTGVTAGTGQLKVSGNGDANGDGTIDVISGSTNLTVVVPLPLPDTIVVNP